MFEWMKKKRKIIKIERKFIKFMFISLYLRKENFLKIWILFYKLSFIKCVFKFIGYLKEWIWVVCIKI